MFVCKLSVTYNKDVTFWQFFVSIALILYLKQTGGQKDTYSKTKL